MERAGPLLAAKVAYSPTAVNKIEINPKGSQQRFVVTSLTAPPAVVYRQVYTPGISSTRRGGDFVSACGVRRLRTVGTVVAPGFAPGLPLI
jgi:hypothetical protein